MKGHGAGVDSHEAEQSEQVVRLLVALRDRFVEVLPSNDFDVSIEHRQAIKIHGVGSRRGDTAWLTPMPIWRSELPLDERMQLFLETACKRVQEFVSQPRRRWPTDTAEAQVVIDERAITVWWGGPTPSCADVALRPIERRELGF